MQNICNAGPVAMNELTILIVAKDELIAWSLSKMLEAEFQVEILSEKPAALERVAQGGLSLLIVDIDPMNGDTRDLIGEARVLDGAIKIMVLSGHGCPLDEGICQPDSCIDKPFKKETVLQEVRKLLSEQS